MIIFDNRVLVKSVTDVLIHVHAKVFLLKAAGW